MNTYPRAHSMVFSPCAFFFEKSWVKIWHSI